MRSNSHYIAALLLASQAINTACFQPSPFHKKSSLHVNRISTSGFEPASGVIRPIQRSHSQIYSTSKQNNDQDAMKLDKEIAPEKEDNNPLTQLMTAVSSFNFFDQDAMKQGKKITAEKEDTNPLTELMTAISSFNFFEVLVDDEVSKYAMCKIR